MRHSALVGFVCLAFGLMSGARAAPAEAPKPTTPVVRVLESGTPPHRLLRFSPREGEVTLIRQRQKIEIEMTLGGAPLAQQDLPTMIFETEMRLVRADRENDMHAAEFELLGRELDGDGALTPAQREMVEDLLSEIDLRGTVEFDSHGRASDASMKAGGDVPAELVQIAENLGKNMKQLISPLPHSPVGVGAQWEVLSTIHINGLEMTNRAVYTLDRFEGDRVHTTMDITVTALPNQPVPSPDPTVTAILLSSKGAGGGAAVFDLSNPLYADQTMHVSTEQEIELTMFGETRTMNQTIVVENTLTAVEPGSR